MSMDVGQLTQMTTWLAEEHRRDKAELIRLQQKVETQEAELQDQSRIIQNLEGRIAGVQAQLLRFSQLEASMQQLKEEVVSMLSQADERRQQEVREAERVRAIERDNMSRALNELRREQQRMPRIEEEAGLRKAEQQRLSETMLTMQQELNSLSQEVENKVRSVSFLEDSRQQDAKRIARLQQESLEALKRIEQQGSRLQNIEDVSQRQERETGELKGLVGQIRAKQREFIQGQLLEAEQAKREMTEWIETMEPYTKHIDEMAGRMQEFAEAFQEDRRVVASVERFQERINKEQTQVAELQRLGEDRQKRQLAQWQEENEKRWRKELLRWDHQWGEQAKQNRQFVDLFSETGARLARHKAHLDALWKLLESQVTYQTQESRRWQGEMNRLLDDRPKNE